MADPEPVRIPEVDLAREAMHAIRGYVYQLYATAQAWARLGPDATLHVERGGDYMTVAADALSGAEVKSTEGSGAVTLRSSGVVTLLSRFWRLAKANPGRATDMIYLTTSPPGVEQGSPFGLGAPGLDYWRKAAAQAPLAPLRGLLATLDLDPDLLDFLAKASDEEVREKLLKPIRFACGEPRLDALDTIVAEALVDVGARFGLAPSDCRDAAPRVVLHLMRLAAQDGERAVTRGQLHELLELAGTSRVSNAALAQWSTGQPPAVEPDHGAIDARELPIEDLVVERADLIEDLSRRLAATGVLWLTGASGLGKTGLALQLAARRNGRWWVVEFDAKTASNRVADRLRRVQRLTLDPDFGGFILDDLPSGLDPRAAMALRRLAHAAQLADGGVVVTAYNPPPPTLAQQLAPGGDPVREAPYFTEADVAAYVAREGGTPELWATPTHLYCGGGQPQFVAARIQGLKRRGWPAADLNDRLGLGASTDDVKAERASIHARLVRELPDHAKILLYRLSVPSLGFDRRLALATAAVAPEISLPGEALDILLGPWVERRGQDRMRVSPLVAQSGANALSGAELLAVHAAVSRDLVSRRPLDPRTLDQLMISALIAKDPEALSGLATAVIMANWETQGILADHLLGLRFLTLNRLILPDKPRVSWLVRMAQLKLCARGGPPAQALAVYRRCLAELEGAPEAKAAPFRKAAINSVLMIPGNPMPVAEWFDLVRGFEGTAVADAPEAGRTPPVDDQAQMLFLWRAHHVESVGELEGIFGVLDTALPQVRAHYLAAFADPSTGLRSLVQPAWVHESNLESFAPAKIAERYETLQAMAESWNAPDLVVECICSRVVLLAEYARQPQAALALLDAAEPRFPDHPRLQRERTKLMIRSGDHAQAAPILEKVLTQTVDADVVERFHILRDLAVGAAKDGDLPLAAMRFSEAALTAERGPTLRDMAGALHADLAVVQLRLGQAVSAGKSLMRAVELIETVDPEDPEKQYRLRGVAGAAAWVWSMLCGVAQNIPDHGVASGPIPAPPWPGIRITPLLLWYQMRQVERVLAVDLGAKSRLDEHRANGVSPYFEGMELRESLSYAIGQVDLETFLDLLSPYCRDTAAKVALPTAAEERVTAIVAEPPWAAFVLDLSEKAQFIAGRVAVTSFAMRAAAEGRWDVLEHLGTRLAADPATAVLTPFVALRPGELEIRVAEEHGLVPALSVLFGPDPFPDENLLLAACLRVQEWLQVSAFIEVVGPQIGKASADLWRRRVESGAFALKNPRLHGPAILAAAAKVETSADHARLILAATPAVALRVPESLLETLRAVANGQ